MTATLRLRHIVDSLWPLRGLWFALPLLAGPGLGGLSAGRSLAVRLVIDVALWATWGSGLVALLVPHPVGLTWLRLCGPALLAGELAAVVVGPRSSNAAALGLATALATWIVASAASTADTMVDGASYGHERRLCLRTPVPLLLGPLPVAAVTFWLGLLAGPLLVADKRWLLGAAATVPGWTAAVVVARRIHALSRRWLVFVPTGLVLHDRFVLAEPVLFPRPRVNRLHLALAGTTAVDLTAKAAGLRVEIEFSTPVAVSLREGRHGHKDCELSNVLVAPLRPGALLRAAGEHRLKVS